MRRAEQAIGGFQIQHHLARPIGAGERIALQALQHARYVDRLARRLAVGGLQPRQLQQVGDDGVHALRLRAHVPDRSGPGRIDGDRPPACRGSRKSRSAAYAARARHWRRSPCASPPGASAGSRRAPAAATGRRRRAPSAAPDTDPAAPADGSPTASQNHRRAGRARTPASGSDCRSAGRHPPGACRPSSRAAWRLNQTISLLLLSMMTPSGSAAVERRSSRNSCTSRCLWNCLRRCRRTTWATISPQIPPRLGGSICERRRSQRSSRYSVSSCQPRYRQAATRTHSQIGPIRKAHAQAQQQNAREPRERESPHRCHRLESPPPR